jgi:protein ImuB
MRALSTRRYLSVWLRRLATDRIERRLPAPADGPRVVTASIKSAQRIVALNDEAAALGLNVGLSLADARARYPSLPVAEADPEADRRLLEAVADWCDRYTPLIGLDPPEGLTLDITGCAHLFGGECALARDLVLRLARQGFSARAAVADTVGCAWAVARYESVAAALVAAPSPHSPSKTGVNALLEGEGDRSGSTERMGEGSRTIERPLPLTHSSLMQRQRCPLPQGERAREADAELADSVFIIRSGETEAAMLPLPVMALRIDAELAAELAAMGLKRVADLAERPRAPLAARFDEQLVRRLDRALGREDEPISPRLPLPAALAEQRFPEPVALERDVLGTIEHLARELARVLERRGEGARLIQVALFRTDGAVHRLEIGTGAPLRDPARVRRLFEDRLAALGKACDPGFGYDVIRLSALVAERSDPAQTGLVCDHGADNGEELAHLIDRLGARFGLRRVTRLVPQDTHIPEFAVAAMPAHAVHSTTGVSSPSHRLRGEGRGEGASRSAQTRGKAPSPDALRASTSPRTAGRGEEASPEQDTLSPSRPIRLFERPEPVEAIAEVPDGPPVRFRWRQVLHEVAHAEGPERIAMQWWRDEVGRALTRDYFRVESRLGARVWLYREGLYGRETERPRWFLHGLFA